MPKLNEPLPEDRGKTAILHAVLFPKSKFNMTTSKQWLKENNYKFVHNRQTTNFYRFRIKEQIKDWGFSTKRLSNGVELVFLIKPN